MADQLTVTKSDLLASVSKSLQAQAKVRDVMAGVAATVTASRAASASQGVQGK